MNIMFLTNGGIVAVLVAILTAFLLYQSDSTKIILPAKRSDMQVVQSSPAGQHKIDSNRKELRLARTPHQSEIHLLPEGYRGPVVIIFNEAGGEPAVSGDGGQVYTIPRDGVLKTQAAPPKEIVLANCRYYYHTREGKRIEIPVVQSKHEMTDSAKVSIFMRMGVLDIKQSGRPDRTRTFTMYMVGTLQDDENVWLEQVREWVQ